MSTISGKKDRQTAKMAARASDLGEYAKAIWIECDLTKKKVLALEMAEHFTVGGKQDFINAVNSIASGIKLDQLVGNAMLKGEGLSTKRF